MKVIFEHYDRGQEIPFKGYLKNRKFKKYLNLESMAIMVATGKLLDHIKIDPRIPFYYSTGLLEYEDYGLKDIAEYCIGKNGTFSQKAFVEFGRLKFSPLTQFKVLQNMPLSFVSINYGLQGDNSVIQSSGAGLLLHALHSVDPGPVLIGAGKVYRNGCVEAGVAHLMKEEAENSSLLFEDREPIEMFRTWALEANELWDA